MERTDNQHKNPNNATSMDLRDVVSKFHVKGSVREIIPWGNGHINDTFRVVVQASKDDNISAARNNNSTQSITATETPPDYILQRINDSIFLEVKKLMDNQDVVISFAQKNGFCGIFQPNLRVKNVQIDDNNDGKSSGEYLYRNDKGWWRMSEFASGYESYDLMPNTEIAHKAGCTIGCMILALSSFDANKLHVTIPDFHNIHHRMNQLNDAWSKTSNERKEDGKELMERIKTQAPRFIEMYNSALSGELPLRASHNDTKLNNLLLHPQKDVGVVVDLDTLMPGYSFFDIGDVLRSGIISAEEDERDLTKVTLNNEAYTAFHEALVRTAQSVLSPKEIEYIPLSGGYMAFVLAVRFLTDFYNFDRYFKTKYPDHNLVRAKCQLRVSDLFSELVNANL